MIKVLGDLHFGVRRNSAMFHKILIDSLAWFMSSVKKTDSVIILGDIFDNRSSVDFNILNDAIDFFIDLSRKCKEVYVLVGNHDLYYKENIINNVNCRFLRFDVNPDQAISPVTIINELQAVTIQNKKCLFIPWIDNTDRKNVAVDALKASYDVVLGHFDTVGVYHEEEADTPLMLDQNEFGENQLIISGHFHRHYKMGIVQYVGAFINQTFNDVGDVKGYHTINKNNDLKFIPGNSPKFEYLKIHNASGFLKGFSLASQEEKDQIYQQVNGNIIKLLLNEYNSENDELYRLFKGMTPLEISVSYNGVNFESGDEGEDFEGFDAKSDMVQIITQYIEKLKTKLPEGVLYEDINELIKQKHIQFKTMSSV